MEAAAGRLHVRVRVRRRRRRAAAVAGASRARAGSWRSCSPSAVARRLGGRTAGWLAAGGLALATDFLFNVMRGDSEGMLVALVARLASCCTSTGATAPRSRVGLARRPAAARGVARCSRATCCCSRAATSCCAAVRRGRAAGGLVPARLPVDGRLVPRRRRARSNPVPGSPGAVELPVRLDVPLRVGLPDLAAVRGRGLASCGTTRRAGDPRASPLAATVLMVTVAVLAELGFTGNIRYVTLPAALVCVLGAVGPAAAAAARGSRWRAAGDRRRGQRRASSSGAASGSSRDERQLRPAPRRRHRRRRRRGGGPRVRPRLDHAVRAPGARLPARAALARRLDARRAARHRLHPQRRGAPQRGRAPGGRPVARGGRCALLAGEPGDQRIVREGERGADRDRLRVLQQQAVEERGARSPTLTEATPSAT